MLLRNFFTLAVTVICQSAALAAECVDFTGYFGGAGSSLRIEQTNCSNITIAGSEPGSGWGMSSGENQPIDGAFHEYVYDETGLGNYHPLVLPKQNEKSRVRVKLSIQGGELVMDVETRGFMQDQWELPRKTVFSFEAGYLKTVKTGKDWFGNPFEIINTTDRNDVYVICEGQPGSTYTKSAVVRRSAGVRVVYITPENERFEIPSIEENIGPSLGFVFEDSGTIKKTFIVDAKIGQGSMLTINNGKLAVEQFKCYKGQGFMPF